MTRAESENGVAARDDITPVERPVAVSGKMPEAAVVAGEFEDTGPVRKSLKMAANGDDDLTAHEVAAQMVKLMGQLGGGGRGGDGSGGPPIDLKKFRKGNWLAQILIGAVVAGSSAFAAYKATEARSVDNQEKVKSNRGKIEENRQAISEVKIGVDEVQAKVDNSYRVQVRLVESVEQLTEEQKTAKERRLKERNAELEEKIRRLERQR